MRTYLDLGGKLAKSNILKVSRMNVPKKDKFFTVWDCIQALFS